MRSAPLSPAHWNQRRGEHGPGTGHNLHGCTSGYQTDGIGPTQPWAAVRSPGAGAHRRTAEGIIIEIRWCPAHNGAAGNEKADEWAKIVAGERDTRGVEWLSCSDRAEVRAMPLPRSLANLKREISEKK